MCYKGYFKGYKKNLKEIKKPLANIFYQSYT